MNLYGHKTKPSTFFATSEQFTLRVLNGEIVGDDWVVCPPAPSYNPATHYPPRWENGAWLVAAMTAADSQAKADADADAADLDNEARIARTLIADLKAGNGTTAQRLARVERVCAFLIRRFVL